MNSTPAAGSVPRRISSVLPDSVVGAALWLTTSTVVALIAFYFLAFDQGAVSVFGADTHVHEFLHDARHLLGFPCH
ncbi:MULTISPECIES: CbtB domain-containing protein [Mycolicibacterium]|jgi:hypothetical protein|uniref:Cobalt transporter subunit (CbtB) n=1 Tax=Mycolicibacterium vanbaalenii (strain DSM 7251 / JCM 13017 / BCRC 16820 / KCTC 9966 / NRRL B-24157 / PYR-1) TaxID=350058 RepID=A1T2T5_MYCVP|nr:MULTISPECIES: CbtB-domain containing protein [Mycolicibacterium]ABM11485.1 hypothetical protein Mvan_0646 [Mycolicibacterium vanbaalenii PYR-1]MCV7128311.1 CbtB-domain containing protein [Mycolicibacterium vanbaalenii PYR-1]MDW5613496.1 CbtB-domain containing protein [Mycolicibacterium sp. D5.8-2]PQP43437.1 CbtB-domain containing protein [Mycolicibacterium austroafricanum]UJL29590.1 CbtB-domain containing protein [Mycolicibacterium vanbaalenii]